MFFVYFTNLTFLHFNFLLGSNSITFEAYTAKDLEAILEARMSGFHAKVFEPTAISFLGRKVAGALGDARRALDVARYACLSLSLI